MLIIIIFVCSLLVTSYGRVIETEFDPRIANGENVKLGEIPYQVCIQRKGYNRHFCGGSIINKNYVITAAHCVEGEKIENLQVLAGIIDLEDLRSIHFLSSIIIHDGYVPEDSYIHDIALIKVTSPFKFSKTVSPVPLPKSNSKVSVNKKAVVSGWGSTRLNGDVSRFLQKVTLLIADQDYCRNAYIPWEIIVRETHICAHDPVEEHGTCGGDSGGPLTVDGVLFGIVSGSLGCGLVDYPSVFTRVPKYIDWIQEYAI